MNKTTLITTTHPEFAPQAEALARALNLAFTTENNIKQADYLLVFTPKGLGLQNNHEKKFNPLIIDFASSAYTRRLATAGRQSEMLVQAMGVKPKDNPLIVDATAGLGRDAFLLAYVGFRVILIERSPILHALLKDALQRAAANPKLTPSVERMALLFGDARDLLQNQHPDVVYLDPMFPERKKSAAVKKEMVVLQTLLGESDEGEALFNAALERASKRVVVKRPRLAPALTHQAPNYTLAGKSSRFDIYLTKNQSLSV